MQHHSQYCLRFGSICVAFSYLNGPGLTPLAAEYCLSTARRSKRFVDRLAQVRKLLLLISGNTPSQTAPLTDGFFQPFRHSAGFRDNRVFVKPTNAPPVTWSNVINGPGYKTTSPLPFESSTTQDSPGFGRIEEETTLPSANYQIKRGTVQWEMESLLNDPGPKHLVMRNGN